MALGNVERLREFSRAGAKPENILDSAPLFHQGKSALWLERANQNQAGALASFDEKIEHPMNAVIKINVNRSGLIALHERARARAREGVAGFVVQGQIRFRFDNDA
jgi:hypothetical protein